MKGNLPKMILFETKEYVIATRRSITVADLLVTWTLRETETKNAEHIISNKQKIPEKLNVKC